MGDTGKYPPTGAYDPATSFEAAETVAPRAKSMRAQIAAYVLRCATHGATREEICRALNMRTPTVCARLNELQARDHILYIAGKRRGDSCYLANVYRHYTVRRDIKLL